VNPKFLECSFIKSEVILRVCKSIVLVIRYLPPDLKKSKYCSLLEGNLSFLGRGNGK
jgi:hypothetical protein